MTTSFIIVTNFLRLSAYNILLHLSEVSEFSYYNTIDINMSNSNEVSLLLSAVHVITKNTYFIISVFIIHKTNGLNFRLLKRQKVINLY